MTNDETKRVTREDLADCIRGQDWGWLGWTDDDGDNPRAHEAFRNAADAIFDALPADPPASADVAHPIGGPVSMAEWRRLHAQWHPDCGGRCEVMRFAEYARLAKDAE